MTDVQNEYGLCITRIRIIRNSGQRDSALIGMQYHQVQLQLYVTRFMTKWCDFYVYSSKGIVVERIFPDKHWQEECIPKLDDYFFDHILPELIEPRCKPSYYL